MSAINFKEATETIVKILKPQAIFIYLMGSLGTDRFHSESDIDIAVFFNKEIGAVEKVPSAALASPKTPYNVQASTSSVVFGSRALHPTTFSTAPLISIPV
jgi:hypothetical protein